MELRQLRQFTVLAETLNFRSAAERLNMAQPPLSVSIRNLEREWGVRLFERTTRDVRLTDAGRAALEEAHAALFHASEASRIARASALGESGRLRVGFVGSAKYTLIPQLFPAFRERFPQVKLELREDNNTKIVASLEANDLDVGIVRVPFAWRSRVNVVTVEHDVFVACLPVGHSLAKKRSLSLADLEAESFIHYSASEVPGLHALTMLMFQEAGFMPLGGQEAVQVETVLCLVESGLGVALVPSVATHHASKGLVFRKLDPLPAAASIGIALAFEPSHENSIVRRFREVATAVLALPPV